MKHLFKVLALLLLLCGVAHAAIDTYTFASDAERARYRHLTEELRCPKCQNQNIADSNAPIAKDLRAEIYRMLSAGESDAQIVDYLVLRYGDFVMYKPPLTGRTLLLWCGPAVLLAGGFVVLGIIVRRRRRVRRVPNGLTADEQQRLAQLLARTSAKRTRND
ncbi:cytochrome c-type biogenesis protein [Pseudomonas matsuisoli]|uniref:Cytochrome c-type biogenesis protein n=1 Tax=Pseudomonas matsuisoli TaxID=1515666 RepID=A0A917Q1F8_9PSED|nr:cytochrome c-type biogenesis protein [Pseudomonas matsuisoli]GGK05367.1 cytochrome c [Pseudomonas matsuisoli]